MGGIFGAVVLAALIGYLIMRRRRA